MNIHFIATSLSGGGAERVMVLLANGFAKRGHNISIITFKDGQSYEILEKVNRITLHQGSIKNNTLRSLVNLTKYYWKNEHRPDFAISLMPKMNFIAILVSLLFGIKVIACEHNNHLRATNSLTRFIWRYTYRYATRLAVLTNFDKPFFEKKGAKVVVMPNPSTFNPVKDLGSRRAKIILAVGSLNRIHHKGFDNLLELIPPVLNANPDWLLKIVGGGDKGIQSLKKLAESKGILDKVVFTGFSNEVSVMMQQSEIFILPSRYEGLPMVLLEAMSQGMACIAYDCKTGPSDIIRDMENGLLIPDQDMVAMRQGLERLIKDPRLRRKLAIRGLHSLDRYAIDNVLKNWEELFEQIQEES